MAEAQNVLVVSTTQFETNLYACQTFVKAHGPDATELIPEKALRDNSLHEFEAKNRDLRAAMTQPSGGKEIDLEVFN